MLYEVEMTQVCKTKISNFGLSEKKKVKRFLTEFKAGGFESINSHVIYSHRVRNKSSDNVHTDDSDFIAKVKFALEHDLWHYHAGFYNIANEYPIDNGYKLSGVNDLVSQWLIHYQRVSESFIVLLDILPHPPMNVLDLKPLPKIP